MAPNAAKNVEATAAAIAFVFAYASSSRSCGLSRWIRTSSLGGPST
jgi:hypothetical protein